MADKETKLSIVVRTVDKATATIKAISARLDAATKPIRNFKDALGDLKEKSGLDDVVGAFGKVGSAVGDVLAKVGMIGGVVAAATVGVLSLIGGFDDLGDKAEVIGVSVDFLAQMRYAAERSGVEVEQLDQGLKGFVSSLGQARAGTGKMAKFLGTVSPALLKNVKAAKSTEEAFDLIANAAAKITDPAKRAAFAQKTLGDASLAPLLARGGKGVKELRDRYLELAGSQEGAASAAGKTDDALKDLHAATDGIKAALVEGLAPALTVIIQRLRDWFKENRSRVAEFAKSLGEKLPGAVSKLVDVFKSIVEAVKPFVDSSTKLKIVILALVAVIVGPLIASIISLGVTIMATPVGWILAGIAAIAVAVYEIYKHWDGIAAWFKGQWEQIKEIFGGFFKWLGNLFLNYTPLGLVIKHWGAVKDFFVELWDGVKAVFQSAWDWIKAIVDKVVGAVDTVIGGVKKVKNFLVGSGDGPSALDMARANVTQQAQGAIAGKSSTEAKVTVDFANMPKGAKVTADPGNTADVDLSMGYQMGSVL